MPNNLGIVSLIMYYALVCHPHEVLAQGFFGVDNFLPSRRAENAPIAQLNNPYLLNPPQCGLSNGEFNRVVGGQPAAPGAWPWMAPIFLSLTGLPSEDTFVCGATIISERHIISAAHCFEYEEVAYTVHLGINNIEKEEGVRMIVEQVTVHPRYNQITNENDVAIIRLRDKIRFTDKIRPVCLPLSPEIMHKNLTGTYPFIAGWGALIFKGQESTQLQEAQIPVVPNSDCYENYKKKQIYIDDRVLCAGYHNGGIDACQGDSGGPLMFPINNVYYLIGVISSGYRCAVPGFPGVYSRVTSFLDFIISNMR